MKLTLGQAATEVGRNKSTISRDIAKGKISAEKMPDGSYLIDPSELLRVYEKRNDDNTNAMVAIDNGALQTTGVAAEVSVLRSQLNASLQRNDDKERMLRDKERQLEDTQQERDHWRKQATYLLEDKREKETALNERITAEQELRERLAHEKAQQELTAQRLNDAEARLEKVRGSWLGRMLFKA
jgi:chromosome segregation ATPase